MIFIAPKTLQLEGQQFIFNDSSNSVSLQITQPFLKAGHILGWDNTFGSPGLGINKSIIKFISQRKARLLIIVLSNPGNTNYWITHDKLSQFIKNHNSEYNISGKLIHVIPWSLFSSKPSFGGHA